MEKRKLGTLEVSALGFGCMGLSHAYGTALEKSVAVKRIHEAYEQGYTFFDTAELYVGQFSDGTPAPNEEVVGEALKPIREKVILATKFGNFWDENHQLYQDGSPASIRKSIEASLKRLQTEYIDLYYQHTQDQSIEPEVVAEEMRKLMDEGKIRYWGISNASDDYIRRADAVCKVTAVQERYSMMARWNEEKFAMLEELGIGFVAYSPMANGFLSGKVQKAEAYEKGVDFRSGMPQFEKSEMEKSRKLMELLNRLAVEKNATPAQISLAWVLVQKPWIVPIPGSTKTERIIENAKAAEIMLKDHETKEIHTLLDTMDLAVFGR